MGNSRIAVSFVHGYQDLEIALDAGDKPALWMLEPGGGGEAFRYPFPRNPGEFAQVASVLAGEGPSAGAADFRTLPRFGFTGLVQSGDWLYAGSWNGVYRLGAQSLALDRFISHRLMSDLHGIYADEEAVITVLTPRDTVVVSDHEGHVMSHFRVLPDLSVIVEPEVAETDWRFVGKQFRGSTGYWHFNYVQRVGQELWLTSRNANSFVVVDLNTRKARLRLMNLCTPALIHDGRKVGERFFFTSVDGKILIASETPDAEHTHQELHLMDHPGLYVRDLVSKLIRLEETALGREPNWCRGIAVDDEGHIHVTIDGRYGTDLSFGLLSLSEDGEILNNRRLRWADVGDETALRYVTGFDVEVLSAG